MKIDALCATGHKWMLSGYGSGFVYISRELQAAIATTNDRLAQRSGSLCDQKRRSASASRRCVARRTRLSAFRRHLFAGRSIELMQSIGMTNIEARALELNRTLTRD
jgi:selenocysteine lyase/cysteine desulfurase